MKRSPLQVYLSWSRLLLGLSLLAISACTKVSDAEPQESENRTPTVDVAIAKTAESQIGTEYIGTTAPIQEVSIKAQTQGQLLKLNAEVGDRVSQGQILAELDGDILSGSVNQARAEREAQIAEVSTAERRVGEASIRAEQARVDLDQAKRDLQQLKTALDAKIETSKLTVEQTQKDANRLSQLLKSGVATAQETERAQTLAKQAQQTLKNEQANARQQIQQAESTIQSREKLLQAALAQVTIEEKSVVVADRQTQAQQSRVDQATTQASFTRLKAPISGVVISRQTEAGNFLQPGQAIVAVGDLSQLKVTAQVSEKILGELKLKQGVQIRLDAFPGQTFLGQLTRISPLANASTRLVPIEIVMPNPGGRLGAGLLARVSFRSPQAPQVTVPESALQKELAPPAKQGQSPGKEKRRGFAAQKREQTSFKSGDRAYLFVISQGEDPVVRARQVTVGDRINGEIAIVNGLQPQERYIRRSSQTLQDGAAVKISAISEPKQP